MTAVFPGSYAPKTATGVDAQQGSSTYPECLVDFFGVTAFKRMVGCACMQACTPNCRVDIRSCCLIGVATNAALAAVAGLLL